MKPKLDLLGSACGVLGAAICVLAAGIRLSVGSNPEFIRMKPMTIFIAGIAIMVFACWMKLEARER